MENEKNDKYCKIDQFASEVKIVEYEKCVRFASWGAEWHCSIKLNWYCGAALLVVCGCLWLPWGRSTVDQLQEYTDVVRITRATSSFQKVGTANWNRRYVVSCERVVCALFLLEVFGSVLRFSASRFPWIFYGRFLDLRLFCAVTSWFFI